MVHIMNVHPGHGKPDDKITITLKYDETGGSPNVAHVLFHENVDAFKFNVTHRDLANEMLDVEAQVPASATTGPIEVDLDGSPPIATAQDFTMDVPHTNPLKVERMLPPQGGPAGYAEGERLTIWLSRQFSGTPHVPQVSFPKTAYGTPVLRGLQVRISSEPYHCQLNVNVPTGARTGRIRIYDENESIMTQPLAFKPPADG